MENVLSNIQNMRLLIYMQIWSNRGSSADIYIHVYDGLMK